VLARGEEERRGKKKTKGKKIDPMCQNKIEADYIGFCWS